MSTRSSIFSLASFGCALVGAALLGAPVLAQQTPSPASSAPPPSKSATGSTMEAPSAAEAEASSMGGEPVKLLGGRVVNPEAAQLTEEATKEMTARHFAEAVELLERAAKADPTHPVVWNNLGSAYLTIDKPVYAERAFKKAIKADHNYAQAHYNLGAAYDVRFEYDKAIESYARAIELDPGMLDGRKNPAVVNNTHLAAIYLVLYKRNLGSLGTGLTRVQTAGSTETTE